MGSDSSPAPEIGGADSPPSSPEARGLSSSAGSSTSDAAASGSAPRPSSRTTRNLLGGDQSVLHGDSIRDGSHARTSLTLLGPRLDSPRDSTAEGGVAPVLGSRAQITYPTPTLPLLPQRYQEALNAGGRSSAETPGAGSSPLEGGELFFPGGGTSFRFRRASTPPQRVSTAAYTVGGRRDDAEEGSEPFRRRPRFRDSPSGPHVVGDELFFPTGPSFRDATSTPAQSTSSTSTAAYFLGSQRRVQGGSGTNPGRLRRRFTESPPTTPHVAGGEISGRNSRALLPGGSSVVWTAGLGGGLTASDVRALELLVGQLRRELGTGGAAAGFWRFCFQYALAEIPAWRLAVQHDDQLVASWRVDLDAGNNSDGRSDAAVASSGSPEVPVPPPPSAGSPATTALGAAHGQGALATPAGMRRSRWDVPSRNCHSCRLRPVAWFLSCCGLLLCEACAWSAAAARCPCQDPMSRPVPFRPPFQPQPLRSLVLLRYPIWQMFYTGESGGLAVIAYYNAVEAFYQQSYGGVRFHVDFFYMQGERWTRRIEVQFTLPSHDGLHIWMFVRVTNAP